MKTRLEILRERKANWDERDLCPVCNGSGDDDDLEAECCNCDGSGVVPVCSWEQANKAEARELAWLEHEQSQK